MVEEEEPAQAHGDPAERGVEHDRNHALLKALFYGKAAGAFSGQRALYEAVKEAGGHGVTMRDVKSFLAKQRPYTRLRPARSVYPRNRIVAYYTGECVQMDLMDMRKDAYYNDGYKFVLLSYDTWSKYSAACPVKNKNPASLIECLRDMIADLKYPIDSIYWDRKGSFVSTQMQEFLRTQNIGNYTTKGFIKAAGCERLIRTL